MRLKSYIFQSQPKTKKYPHNPLTKPLFLDVWAIGRLRHVLSEPEGVGGLPRLKHQPPVWPPPDIQLWVLR